MEVKAEVNLKVEANTKVKGKTEVKVEISVRKSTHSTPRREARSMLRVDTERRFLPRSKGLEGLGSALDI